MQKKRLASWSDAQRDIAAIVEKMNADPALARAAMANPLFALEEIGYEIEPAVHREFEERIRFSVEQVAKLGALRKKINRLARREIDPEDHAHVHKLLFQELKLPKRVGDHDFSAQTSLDYLPRPKWASGPPDVLELLRGKHELVDALLEYRALEASEPRLASRDFYDSVRHGSVDVRMRSATIRLRADSKRIA